MLIKAILLIGFCFLAFMAIELFFSRKNLARQERNNRN